MLRLKWLKRCLAGRVGYVALYDICSYEGNIKTLDTIFLSPDAVLPGLGRTVNFNHSPFYIL